ncbi:MAG: two-component regulator propeller domain-containing protein [Clostridium butyricum]|nr:two-component regulator propeller domain-containing protein [Clostridium butyricum]
MKNTILKISVIFFILNLFTSISVIKAEAYSNIVFKNITIEDGLAQATVECMIQDSRGYMWFGTNDGLSRYNGHEFEVYRNEIGVDNSIVNNYIVCMNEDRDGNLWIGTIDGASKINLSTNEITNYKNSSGLSNNNVTEILVTKDGEILLATIDGLNIYDKTNDRFTRIFNNEYIKDQEIYSLDEDINGDIWLGGSKNITKINLKNNTCEDFSDINKEYEKINDCAYKVLCDDKYIWVGTISNGLYKINIETSQTETINLSNSKISSNNIHTIMKDKNGIMWIGTDSGLVKYDSKNDEYNTYVNKAYDKYSLVDDYVYSVIQDRSGLIWVGTYAGVSMFEPENKIEHYKVDPLSHSSINENLIHGIYEDDDGLIWIGTNTKGVNVLDRKNENIYDISEFTNGTALSSNSINDISGHANKIFIATNNGLNIYDKNTRKISVYNEKQGLNAKKIRNITYDDSGVLWIGTTNGINILNLETDEITDLNYILDKYSLDDRYSECIFKDSEGFYWLGSFLNGGLIKIDPYNNTAIQYKHEGKDGDLSNNTVRTIIEDDEKNIWVGTSGGLNKLDKETGKFKTYTTSDGLANNNIYGIVIDETGNLWMSTNLGISKLDREKDRFFNLNITDGLQSNEFNGHSYGKLKSGELIFGGINGLNIFNPDEILNNMYIPRVEFDRFRVNGRTIDTLQDAKLNYNENTIGIKFFLPDYKNIKNIQYYYSLEGAGNDWSLVNTNELVLSNLGSGTYIFRVKARNSSGIFSEESSFKFTIKPPFWRSAEFILIYILIGVSLVVLIVKSKNTKMRLLDDMVSKRTRELSDEMEKNTELLNKIINLEKRKNAYLVNISHDLRTPLNVLSSIHQLINQLNKSESGIEREKLDYYMNIFGKNVDRLLKLINDLIDSSKIEHGNYHINIGKYNIVYIVEDTALSLKDYVESKNIELIIDPEVEECFIECDSNEIERCIINLVNNAAKFTDEGGRILVSVVELENEVKIMVSDTGIGIDEKHLETVFDRFNQVIDSNKETKGGSGLGLTITKLIVGLHNGRIFAESEINVGSKFTIILPKKQPKEKVEKI